MAELSDRLGRQPVDALVRVFVLAMIVGVVTRPGRVTEWPWLLASDALALLLVELIERAPRASTVAGFAALWYPLILVPAYYAQLGVIGLDAERVRDLTVLRWEHVLFSGQPAFAWQRAMPQAALSTVLHACYLAHYAIFIGVPAWLWLRVGREEGQRAVFTVSLAFYVCFVSSLVFPVAGPGYSFPHPTGPATLVPTARLVHWVIDSGSSYGTAFPSSHVAASWAAVLVAIRRAPGLALLLAPVALGLAAGTVYGQFHYVLDAAAGAAVALLCFAFADPLRTWLGAAAPR
jgi:membrane-associated phospholipid phosphatase